ncbi:MAG: hypothetical protein IJA72_04955 [Clostridia bacterium]|nr:hypothetical protein [Clostridia bacterium]
MVIKSRKDELDLDFAILNAKYLLHRDFEEIKEEFEKLCEMEYYYALSSWYDVYDLGDNSYIDEIVDNYPTASKDEIMKLHKSRLDDLGNLYERDEEKRIQKEQREKFLECESIKRFRAKKLDKPKTDKAKCFEDMFFGLKQPSEELVKAHENFFINSIRPEDSFMKFYLVDTCKEIVNYYGKATDLIKPFLEEVAGMEYSKTLQQYQLQGKSLNQPQTL